MWLKGFFKAFGALQYGLEGACAQRSGKEYSSYEGLTPLYIPVVVVISRHL